MPRVLKSVTAPMPRQARVRIMRPESEVSMNRMTIFVSATVIAIIAIVLQRRRGGRQS